MKKRRGVMKVLTLLMLLCISVSGILAQTKRIAGVVKDDAGEPVIGASVSVRGMTIGTVTDFNGSFTLDVPENSVLVVSYIGFQSQTVVVDGKTDYNIRLFEDTQALDEVVVIGYGTVRKRDLTGAVGSVRRKDMGDVSVTNVEQLIQGKVAGVEIVSNSGLPGTNTAVMIRGTGTIYNSSPLYVIDGMPGDINSVNQYDIESIEILKDASSTAIYGARAANGVVLVTTKRGVRGVPKVNLNMYVGVSSLAKKLDFLNANEYIDLAKEMNPNFFTDAKRFVPVSQGGLGYDETWARQDRSNMQDEIFRSALQQEYHLNVSGGGDNSLYSVSGSYTDMEAITIGYDYKKFNVMANNEFTIRKYVKLGQNFSVRRTNTNGTSPDFIAAFRYAPYMPIEDAENSWGYSKTTSVLDGSNDSFNAVATLNTNFSNNKTTSIRELVFAEVSLFDMFKWRTQFLYTNYSANRVNWSKYTENGDLINPAKIEEYYTYSQGATLENYLNFDKTFGIHTVNVMVGNTYASSKNNNGRNLTASGSSDGDIAWENYEVLLITKTPKYTVTNNSTWHSAYLSYYGRVNYSLMDKYLFTFNYRQDASPNFAPSNRWGRFPSVALAWKADQEEFIKKLELFSQLKLRLSVGKSGNDRISSYAYLANLFSGEGNNVVAAFGTGQNQFNGITINGLPATGIKWETSTSYNIGLDFGLWNNAFTGSIDLYKKKTDGILVKVPIPGSSGIDEPPFKNAAEVENKGIDITLGYQKQLGDFNLSVSGVVGYNKNEVTSLGEGEPISMASQTIGYLTRTEVGHSVGEFYGYKVDKVLSTAAEADAYNSKYNQSAAAGDIAFKDIAGPKDANGNPTGPDGVIDDNDRTFIGKPTPDWTFGLNISLAYKNFDLQLGFTGVTGNSIFDYARVYELQSVKRIFNQEAIVLDRWKKDGDVTSMPRAIAADPNNNLRTSDRYVQDASYFRAKNLTLGYTVPFKNNLIIDRLRLYVTCQNLFTITGYDGYDPEVGSTNNQDSQNYNLERGIVTSYNMIPIPRTFLFGVQATF